MKKTTVTKSVVPEGFTLLYRMKPKQWVKTEDGNTFFFDHLDGMYSYCKDKNGNILHYAGYTPVVPAGTPP